MSTDPRGAGPTSTAELVGTRSRTEPVDVELALAVSAVRARSRRGRRTDPLPDGAPITYLPRGIFVPPDALRRWIEGGEDPPGWGDLPPLVRARHDRFLREMRSSVDPATGRIDEHRIPRRLRVDAPRFLAEGLHTSWGRMDARRFDVVRVQASEDFLHGLCSEPYRALDFVDDRRNPKRWARIRYESIQSAATMRKVTDPDRPWTPSAHVGSVRLADHVEPLAGFEARLSRLAGSAI